MAKLYLDDLRNSIPTNEPWVILRSEGEILAWILTHGLNAVDEISFDHDLGLYSGTGMDVAHKIIDLELDGKHGRLPPNFKYRIHSANPTGEQNIRGLLNGYFRHENTSKEKGRGVEIR